VAVALAPTTRIEFEAADADADPLSWTLLYAPDATRWQVLATGTDARSHTLGRAIEHLPGSANGRLRLLVSDGVHTTVADGEPTVSVVNGPPIVRIDTPALTLTVPLQANVTLSGGAWDREDGRLGDGVLAWHSSRDGELGAGRELRTRALSPGAHEITLRATDSTGAVSAAAVWLTVDASMVQPVADAPTEAALAGIFDAFASGGDPRPPPPAARVPVVEPPVVQILGLVAVTLSLLVLAVWAAVIRFDRPREA
jgi:hypothetical protein